MTSQETIMRRAVIDIARSWVGTPYVHQASIRGIGCDCLGLVRGVWRELYGSEPETPPNYTADWAEALGRETLREAAFRHMRQVDRSDSQPGDVILFRWRAGLPAKHIAILSENERFIHSCEGLVVSEVNLSPWWERRIDSAFQFPRVSET